MDWRESTTVLGRVGHRTNQNKNAKSPRTAGLTLDESTLRPLLPASRSSQPTPPTSPPAVPSNTHSVVVNSRISGCAISEPMMSRIIAKGEVIGKGEHELSEVLAELRDGMIAENSEDVKVSPSCHPSCDRDGAVVLELTWSLRYRIRIRQRIASRLRQNTLLSPPFAVHPLPIDLSIVCKSPPRPPSPHLLLAILHDHRYPAMSRRTTPKWSTRPHGRSVDVDNRVYRRRLCSRSNRRFEKIKMKATKYRSDSGPPSDVPPSTPTRPSPSRSPYRRPPLPTRRRIRRGGGIFRSSRFRFFLSFRYFITLSLCVHMHPGRTVFILCIPIYHQLSLSSLKTLLPHD